MDYLLFLVLFSVVKAFGSAMGRLETKSTCTCPGYNLTYECTVMADQLGGLTLWEGTALNCESTQGEIRLLLSRFSEGRAYGTCNDGAVEGQGLGVEGHTYTSRLVVNVSTEMIGRGIQCVYDDGTITHLVGVATIRPTTAPFPPPDGLSITFADLSSRRLSVRWSNVDPNCPALHYTILSSNCGSCPTTTTNTTVTCTDVPTNGNTCTIAVQTAVCGEITGNRSDTVKVILTGASSCDGAIASASLFAIAFVVCLVSFVMYILIKGKFKEKFNNLIKFRQREAEDSPYTDVRHPTTANVDTDLTANIAYGQPSPSLATSGE